jgi:hypothetical protein
MLQDEEPKEPEEEEEEQIDDDDNELQDEEYDSNVEEHLDDNDDDNDEIPSVRLPIFNKEKKLVGYTIIDEEDEYKLLNASLTQFVDSDGYTRIYVTPFKQKSIPLSHFLTGVPSSGFVKDHINGNSSDNRKKNVRNASFSQNAQNRAKKPNCTSIYKGVRWEKDLQKWSGSVTLNNNHHYLGCSVDEMEIAKLYDKFVLFHFGENAKTNNILSKDEKLKAIKTVPKFAKRQQSIYGIGICKLPCDSYLMRWVNADGKTCSLSFRNLDDAVKTRHIKIQETKDEKLKRIREQPIERDENNIPIIKTNKNKGISLNIKVDEEYYYEIIQYSWSCKLGKNPKASIDGKLVNLPEFVLTLAQRTKNPNETIDHIYQDYTDCRSESLRYATPSQQGQNQRKRKNCTSIYKGVQKIETNKFRVIITLNHDSKDLGTFDNELEAARAYDNAVDLYYGSGMKNFSK